MEEWQSKEFKKAKADELAATDLSMFSLGSIDPRLEQYVRGVADDPDGHNLFEILAVQKFIRLMGRYHFDAGKVREFARFYERLKFSGLHGRRCYKLTPVQYFQFASILGFVRRDGYRLVRNAILFVPRKFSKTTSTASLATYELYAGDANAQAYCAANAYKQAQICFKEISKITRQTDPKHKYFKATRETLKWVDGNPWGKESFVECLTGGGGTKDGLSASLVIFDEYAAAKYVAGHSDSAELMQVLRSSMGTRREPLTVIITTASRVVAGPFEVELDNAKKTLLGEIDNDAEFAHIFQPDAWEMDDEHIGLPSVWHKCNPHIGITIHDEFYGEQYEAALNDPDKMIEFKTKLLNIFVAGNVQAWMPLSITKHLVTEKGVRRGLEGMPCMVALDLSVSDDFSVAVYNCYDEDSESFHIDLDCYIPEETLRTHPNRRLYQRWVDDGWMRVCAGKIIDGDQIAEDIMDAADHVDIQGIGYDAYKNALVINPLRAAIGPVADKILKAVPQTQANFTNPVEVFEMLAKCERPKVFFSQNPILPYCFANCYIDTDTMGNKKPFKMKANLKIDAAIGTLMTFWLWNRT